MEEFLNSNEWQWRLARAIVQGIFGVIIANVDLIFWSGGTGPRMACIGRGSYHGRALPGDGGARLGRYGLGGDSVCPRVAVAHGHGAFVFRRAMRS